MLPPEPPPGSPSAAPLQAPPLPPRGSTHLRRRSSATAARQLKRYARRDCSCWRRRSTPARASQCSYSRGFSCCTSSSGSSCTNSRNSLACLDTWARIDGGGACKQRHRPGSGSAEATGQDTYIWKHDPTYIPSFSAPSKAIYTVYGFTHTADCLLMFTNFPVKTP